MKTELIPRPPSPFVKVFFFFILGKSIFLSFKKSESQCVLLPSTKSTIPLEIAVEKNLITPMGAAVLKSLLNITVTTATVTQTVKRTIKVSPTSGTSGAAELYNEHSITFQEALRRGLIDENTGIFTDPESNKEIALDEAISLGLVILGQSSTSSTRKSSTTSLQNG